MQKQLTHVTGLNFKSWQYHCVSSQNFVILIEWTSKGETVLMKFGQTCFTVSNGWQVGFCTLGKTSYPRTSDKASPLSWLTWKKLGNTLFFFLTKETHIDHQTKLPASSERVQLHKRKVEDNNSLHTLKVSLSKNTTQGKFQWRGEREPGLAVDHVYSFIHKLDGFQIRRGS